jgi:predicted porin
MQKKLIALAVAAVTSGAAFAQSNVTIYGTVDMGYLYRGGNNGGLADTKTQHAFQSNSAESNIGFKGIEDLGNGLKALFDLQYVLTPDQNTALGSSYTAGAGLGKGHQYVGLTGGFGTAVAGQLDGIRYGLFAKYNPFGNYSVGNFASMTTQYDRASNAVAYISPNFGGFTAVLAFATNTQTTEGGLNGAHAVGAKPNGGNTGDDRLLSANVNYTNGPLSLDLNYETTSAVGYTDGRLYVADFGASYDFGVVKIMGIYDVIKGKKNSLIGGNVLGPALDPGLAVGQDYNKRNWEIGASVPFGKAKALVSYGQVKNRTLSDADASKISVGGRYSLSKRTELYADFAHISNDSHAVYTINPMGNSDGVIGGGVNGFDLGIKHTF